MFPHPPIQQTHHGMASMDDAVVVGAEHHDVFEVISDDFADSHSFTSLRWGGVALIALSEGFSQAWISDIDFSSIRSVS